MDAVVTSLTAAAGDLTSTLGTIAPIAIGIFALQWGIRKGIKFFRSASN
jgi:hypothetical protein